MVNERTSLFLMANLGSEVSRMLDAKSSGNLDFSRKCFDRALKILADVEKKPDMISRKTELENLRKVLLDDTEGTNKFAVSSTELKNYFYPFALRLRQP